MRVAVLAAALMLAPGAAVADCKLALALGLDISSSVDEKEYALQRDGLADAFAEPEIIDAILTPPGAHIAIAAYEWSGSFQQETAIGWTVIDTPEAALSFSARLRAHARPFADFATALGKAAEYGAKLMASAPDCARRVLDISGDGVNNDGDGPEAYRDAGALEGLTINGLVIEGEVPDPAPYYRDHVLQGQDAFLVVAHDHEDFRRAIATKLMREVKGPLVIGAAR